MFSLTLGTLRLNLQKPSALIWIMEMLRSFSINHLSAVLCIMLLPFLKVQVKSKGTHVKELIWLYPLYITRFVMLLQPACGAHRGLCGGLETPYPTHTHTHNSNSKPGFNLLHSTGSRIASRPERSQALACTFHPCVAENVLILICFIHDAFE